MPVIPGFNWQCACGLFGLYQYLLTDQASYRASCCADTGREDSFCCEELREFRERREGADTDRTGGGKRKTWLTSTVRRGLSTLETYLLSSFFHRQLGKWVFCRGSCMRERSFRVWGHHVQSIRGQQEGKKPRTWGGGGQWRLASKSQRIYWPCCIEHEMIGRMGIFCRRFIS